MTTLRCTFCGLVSDFKVDKLTKKDGVLVFRCDHCGHIGPVASAAPPAQKPAPQGIVGWVLVHDEQTAKQTFELKMGPNKIGRKSFTGHVDIAIDTKDLSMSREHCIIDVVEHKKEGLAFLLHDLESDNGTILNGQLRKKLSPQDIIYLNDRDTFQIGLTKVVFRKNDAEVKKHNVESEVWNSDYTPTVLIKK